MRDREYERFGPWAVEISELDPLPPLFQPYLRNGDIPLLSVKIPRKIERRDAHPGMNLYDYVVNLYEDNLLILQRVENDVRVETFFYRDIQYLHHAENLLKSNLRLVMLNTSFDLPFNSVSAVIMQRLISQIRQLYFGQTAPITTAGIPDFADNQLSFYFMNLLSSEKLRSPEIRVLASQAEESVGDYESSIWRKFLLGVVDKRLLESLHLSDGKELKIINRGKMYKYRGQAVYGADAFFLPLDKIVDIRWKPDARDFAVVHLHIMTDTAQVSFAFIQNNPAIAGYDRFLREVVKGTAVSAAN